MTERGAAQNQKKVEIPSNYAKAEPKKNEAHQLPNMDPDQNETRDWNRTTRNGADWGDWGFYFGPFTAGYGENRPLAQEKERGRRKDFILGGGQRPRIHKPKERAQSGNHMMLVIGP